MAEILEQSLLVLYGEFTDLCHESMVQRGTVVRLVC